MKPQSTFKRAWHFLTRPHPSITDVEQKRQTQLLAGLIIALTAMSLLASFMLIGRNNGEISQTVKFLWGALFFTMGLYLLNRSGRYRLSATIFVIYNFLVVFAMPVLTNDLSWLWFPMMPLLLSAMLLPVWATAVLFLPVW